MSGQDVLAKALVYRAGDATLARFDLLAALDGVPGAVGRFGTGEPVREALRLLDEGLWCYWPA